MGKPKIRFKGFDNDWEQRKLSDIAVLTSSKRVHAEDYVETGVPFYRGKEISELKEHKPISEVLYITEYKYNEISSMYGSPKEGDLLITAVGTLGNTWVIDQTPFYFKDGNLIWFKDIKCNPKYLDYAMSTADGQKKILASAIGSNQKALTMVKLNELEFMFPGKAEQDKIAEYFSYLDNLITLHQRKCEETKKMKKYMLQKMFPQNGSKVPEIRFKGFTDDWEQRKLGEIADIVGGGTPSTGNPSYWNGEIDWYAPAEITGQIYANSSQKKITDLGYENSSAKMLPPGTVLFTSRAGIGKTAILTRKGCTNQGFQSIVPHRGELDTYFIFSRTEELKRYGELVGAGSTFVEVSGKQMAVMELMMPPTMREQQTIGGFFQQLDHLITLHQRECIRLKRSTPYVKSSNQRKSV